MTSPIGFLAFVSVFATSATLVERRVVERVAAETAPAAKPAAAAATSCAGNGSIATAATGATTIVIARVERVIPPAPRVTQEPDGSTTITVSSAAPSRIDLAIEDTFKGSVKGFVTINSTVPLVAGSRYLIYGSELPDRVVVAPCARLRLMSDAEADLRYLEGARSGVVQGVVYGQVLINSADVNGFLPLSEAIVVVTSSNVTQSFRASKYGQFEIVLPPGSYLFWVELEGRQLTNPERLDVSGGDQAKNFSVVASADRR